MYVIDIIGEVCVYIIFVFFITMAIIEYVRADKPYISALVGLNLIMIISGLFIVYKVLFPYSSLVPGYVSHTPPVGLLWIIYYLTFSRKRRSRFLVILAIIGLVALIVTYLLAFLHN